MYHGKRNSDPIYVIGDIHDQSREPDQRLAVLIENAVPNDPRLLEVLVDQYAENISLLSRAILEDNWVEPAPEGEILKCVGGAFTQAVANPTDFRSKESVQDWLYGITFRIANNQLRSKRRRRLLQIGWKNNDRGASSDTRGSQGSETFEPYWEAVDRLNCNQRSAIILHYLFDLSIPDIAKIMGVSHHKADAYIKTARAIISEKTLSSPGSGLNEFEAALQARWPFQEVNKAKIQQQVAASMAENGGWGNLLVILKRSRDVALLAIITLAILIGLSTISRMDSSESKPLFAPTLGPLPTPINATTAHIVSIDDANQLDPEDLSTFLYSIEPDMSSNGNLLAFTSSINTLVNNDNNGFSDIFMLNFRNIVIERLSVTSDGSDANGASRSPSLSSDGRYITFSSLADNLVPDDTYYCRTFGLEINCSDIFVRDLWTGITERVSLAYDGKEANGHSYAPSISANGRWLVYWSEASNIVSDYTDDCQKSGQDRVCLDVYIYDRETGQMERIPIGRDYRQVNPEQLAISRDGRLLALTIYRSDTIAQSLQFSYLSEAFIYDNKTRQFEPVNFANNGAPGNHASYNARISSDGNKVAFVSQANNLIENDFNNKADVFIRDLLKGEIKLVSTSFNGEVGNEESGTRTVPGITGWGQQVSISDDGRYVAFISLADNLAPESKNVCDQLGMPVCAHVFVHDSQTGVTQLVLPGRGRDSFFLYTSISGDGRWVVVMEQLFVCLQGNYCSEIWLYDRHNGQLINPLRENLPPGMKKTDIWPESTFKHHSMINTIDFSPNGKIVATGTNDGTVRLWQISEKEPLSTSTVYWSATGHSLPITKLVFTPDGEQLFSSSTDGTIYLWQVEVGGLVRRLIKNSRPITSLTISRDGNYLAAGSVGSAWIWQRVEDDINLIDTIEISGYYINDLDFSPDGTLLALAVSDGTLWMYHIDNREVILRLGGHHGKVYTTRFSPDGRFLATGSEDKTINLWKLEKRMDGKVEAEITSTFEHANLVKSLVFSPDGKILASASLGKLVNLWSVPDGKLLKPPISVHLDEIVSLDFSNDGKTLAAGTIGGNLHLWQIDELGLK